jgi:hypothetical protein
MLLFEKLIATQMVKKFFSFYGSKMFLGLLGTRPFIKTSFHTLLHLHLTASIDSTHFSTGIL